MARLKTGGAFLEGMIRKAADEYHSHGEARLWKAINDQTERTPADFFGFTKSGRCILVEAKNVDSSVLRIGGKSGIHPHQWISLVELHRAGGIALIAWRRPSLELTSIFDVDVVQSVTYELRSYSIPWDSIPSFLGKRDDHDPFGLFTPYF